MRLTSGPLAYHDAKGMHLTDSDPWWIDTGISGLAFQIDDQDGRLVASMTNWGRLIVQRSYLWDGSSGPTIDGKADPVPSLVHDTLYQSIRARKLPTSFRKRADALYYELLRERGMGWWRANARYYGLRLFGWVATRPGAEYSKRTAA